MAHFAQVIDGIVSQVIVAEQHYIDTLPDRERWVQTSFNTRDGVHYGPDGQPDGGVALRYTFAGVGYSYHPERDIFAAPQPWPSWVWSEELCRWVAPVPYPNDGQEYVWAEEAEAWLRPGLGY